ncbi:DUF4352 domain-containing protein [Nocardiopsis ganjiahuensis]|uniref:DUF4352 domain-containing protein n=1 Tax=Nocardiopsis ganjiahuensis TaxID=239984 RepID=UPI00034A9B19|nr:DUF4352 domain-containing protein [Nocardiopsis ganjiahuensis]
MDKSVLIAAASAVTVALALVFGFGAGWFSHQLYLRDGIESAMEDLVPDEPAEEPTEEPAEEPAEPAEEPGAPGAADPWPDAAPMGESASDGTWDITLTGVERTSQVSGSYSSATAAEGREYLVLEAEMTNASNGPQSPDVEDCVVVDEDGNRYTYDFDALLALDDEDAMYTEVNPGGSTTVGIPFELAEGTAVEVALLTGVWDGAGVAELAVEE